MATKVKSKFKLSKIQALMVALGVAVVGVIVLIATHAASPNLVNNGSFESPFGNPAKLVFNKWTPTSSKDVLAQRLSYSGADSGNYVLNLRNPFLKTAKNQFSWANNYVPITGGCTYDISARSLFVSGANTYQLFVGSWQKKVPHGTTIVGKVGAAIYVHPSTANKKWNTVKARGVAPKDADILALFFTDNGFLHSNSNLPASEFDWDSVSVTQVSCPSPQQG